MCSPSTALKVNYLVIRYLHFRSVRGDLQEGHGCASRCQFLLFLCRSPIFPSTKSAFLCAFCLRPPVFGSFEHKIEVFVRFWGLEPPFSGISSTKSGFLCAFALRNPRFRAFQAQNRDFCAHLGSGTLIFRRFEHKIGKRLRDYVSSV